MSGWTVHWKLGSRKVTHRSTIPAWAAYPWGSHGIGVKALGFSRPFSHAHHTSNVPKYSLLQNLSIAAAYRPIRELLEFEEQQVLGSGTGC